MTESAFKGNRLRPAVVVAGFLIATGMAGMVFGLAGPGEWVKEK